MAVTRTGVAVTAASSAANASRDSGLRLVTRISARSNSASSSTTFQKAVPRAPTWPRIRASGRARNRAPTAVIAPVRAAVIIVASMIDTGMPVPGVIQRQQPELAGQAAGVVRDEVADDLDAPSLSGVR